MEVNLPSGFTVDTDAIPSLLLSYAKSIKKVETKNGETTLVLYFDSVSWPNSNNLLSRINNIIRNNFIFLDMLFIVIGQTSGKKMGMEREKKYVVLLPLCFLPTEVALYRELAIKSHFKFLCTPMGAFAYEVINQIFSYHGLVVSGFVMHNFKFGWFWYFCS